MVPTCRDKNGISAANDEGDGKAGVCVPIWRGLRGVLELEVVGVEEFVDGIVGKPDDVVKEVAGVKEACCTSI